ncbi:MAG: glycerol kinase GlpK [Anaerolineaceae bacterium]|nr:glycerol kinase GlpK [Anaerolineaceae bacterium]
MKKYIAALDQGTTSSRCIIFNHDGEIVSLSQAEHQQIFPKPGWVEHNPIEILNSSIKVMKEAIAKKNIDIHEIAALGITNQRETCLLWNKTTGQPYGNAIVWQDMRTDVICNQLIKTHGEEFFRKKTGLPISPYFSATKVKWLLENDPQIASDAAKGMVLFGTIDTWLIWNLTGGIKGGIHITDITNASRTLLYNIFSQMWDEDLLRIFGIPIQMMPEVRPSSQFYGDMIDVFDKPIAISAALGDQQAALFGQTAFNSGQAKNTYGTGCFLLLNTGEKPVISKHGLLTTIGYQIAAEPVIYCLEGSIAITGALIQWLRDNMKIIQTASEIESLAASVEDNGGVYFVPAFSGLFAPYWRNDARGIVAGLTRYATSGHLARAALEATAFQTKDVLDAMYADSQVKLHSLAVDGGMVQNELLMQFQADILNIPIIRPKITETTALGAAYAAGLAMDFWKNTFELSEKWKKDVQWNPKMDETTRQKYYGEWKKAIDHSLHWVS